VPGDEHRGVGVFEDLRGDGAEPQTTESRVAAGAEHDHQRVARASWSSARVGVPWTTLARSWTAGSLARRCSRSASNSAATRAGSVRWASRVGGLCHASRSRPVAR
jgi:hypothetical protein